MEMASPFTGRHIEGRGKREPDNGEDGITDETEGPPREWRHSRTLRVQGDGDGIAVYWTARAGCVVVCARLLKYEKGFGFLLGINGSILL